MDNFCTSDDVENIAERVFKEKVKNNITTEKVIL